MRQQIQKFGRALSGMVMPNIGAFIAWGFVTALFIPSGWWPNTQMARLVDPMLTYLLPLLIAYTAGRNVAGERGGVAGGFHRRVYLLEARARSVSPTFFGEWQLRLDVFDIVLLVFERNIGDFQMLESLVQLFVRNACRRPVIRSGGKCRGFFRR